jgi:hypothetical protein
MSTDAKLAVVGTVAATAWAVQASLSIPSATARAMLAVVSIAVPLTIWWLAHRLRAHGSPKADTLMVWALCAAITMGSIVDFVSARLAS